MTKNFLREELDQLIHEAKYIGVELRSYGAIGLPLIFSQIRDHGPLGRKVEALCFYYYRISDLYKLVGDFEASYEYAKLHVETISYYNLFQDERLLLSALSHMAHQLVNVRAKYPKKLANEDQEIVRLLNIDKKDLIGEFYLMLAMFAVRMFRDTGSTNAKKLAHEYSDKSLEYLPEEKDPLKIQQALLIHLESGVSNPNNPWESLEEIEKITKKVKKIIKTTSSVEGRKEAEKFYVDLKEGLANYYFNDGLFDQAIINYKEVRKNREEHNDIGGKIAVSISLGNCMIQTGEYDSAIAICQSVLNTAEPLDDWSSLSQLHRIIGLAMIKQNKKNDANLELEKSEEFLRKLKPGIGVLHMWLALARLKRQNKLEYKNYYDEAIKMAKGLDQKETLMQICYEVGVALYQDQPNFKDISRYFSETLGFARELHNVKVASAATKYLNILAEN